MTTHRENTSSKETEILDTEELRSFRERWKKELHHKDERSSSQEGHLSKNDENAILEDTEKDAEESDEESKKRKKGLKLYKHGLQAEKKGDFHRAVGFYREAYKLDPQLEDVKNQRAIDASLLNAKLQAKHETSVVIHDAPPVEPEIETSELHISVLPSEVLERIFSFCGAVGVERASLACKYWLAVCRLQSLWKVLCYSSFGGRVSKYEEKGCPSFRRLYIDWPVVRFDGVYYSKNVYIRAGLTEGVYYQPIHQVYYYRYLRFFPDGSCVSATSFDKPKDVVQLLTRLPIDFAKATSTQPLSASTQPQTQQHISVMSLQAVRSRSNVSHGRYEMPDESHIEISVRRPQPKRYSFNFVLQVANAKTIKGLRSSKLQVLQYYGAHDSGGEPDIFPVDSLSRFLFTTVPEGLLPSG